MIHCSFKPLYGAAVLRVNRVLHVANQPCNSSLRGHDRSFIIVHVEIGPFKQPNNSVKRYAIRRLRGDERDTEIAYAEVKTRLKHYNFHCQCGCSADFNNRNFHYINNLLMRTLTTRQQYDVYIHVRRRHAAMSTTAATDAAKRTPKKRSTRRDHFYDGDTTQRDLRSLTSIIDPDS
jgi:hypothetical protein